jgi:hypothetical protein
LFIFFSFRADLISLQPMLNSNVDIEYWLLSMKNLVTC